MRQELVFAILMVACAAVTSLPAQQQVPPQAPGGGGSSQIGVSPRARTLRMSLWMIISTDAKPYVGDVFDRHIAYWVKAEKEGALFGSGPVYAPDGTREYGMLLVRATSPAEARALADRDPMHLEGFRTYALHRWMLNEGRMNITLDFSDGTYTFK